MSLCVGDTVFWIVDRVSYEDTRNRGPFLEKVQTSDKEANVETTKGQTDKGIPFIRMSPIKKWTTTNGYEEIGTFEHCCYEWKIAEPV